VIRVFTIVLLGLSLAGCGLGTPQPTQQEVLQKDLVGTTWRYQGAAPATNCEITFNTNATYSLVRCQPGSAVTNSGWWNVSSPYLELFPADRFSPAFERHTPVRWWFIPVSANQVALFGGDSLNPKQWVVLSKVGGEPAVASRPFSAVIAPAHTAGEDAVDLVRTIGFSLLAGLAVWFAVVVGLRLRKALGKVGAAKRQPVDIATIERLLSKTAKDRTR
jgi:hypothetical protein